jgi:hypothetical protein
LIQSFTIHSPTPYIPVKCPFPRQMCKRSPISKTTLFAIKLLEVFQSRNGKVVDSTLKIGKRTFFSGLAKVEYFVGRKGFFPSSPSAAWFFCLVWAMGGVFGSCSCGDDVGTRVEYHRRMLWLALGATEVLLSCDQVDRVR